MFNPWKIICNSGFDEDFCKTTNIRQLRKWKLPDNCCFAKNFMKP